jgi:hypothetical protein
MPDVRSIGPSKEMGAREQVDLPLRRACGTHPMLLFHDWPRAMTQALFLNGGETP